jgi:CRISPR-associated endonuclease/helicase Cas3
VYENAGVLWRTVEELARAKRIETPGGLRALIEDVYDSADALPVGLLPVAQRAEGKEAGNAAIALYGTLKVPHGYDACGEAWLHELRVPTRLGDPQTALRLARVRADGRLAPWADVQPTWKAWALSEVKVSASRVPLDAAPLPEHAAAVERARNEWGRFEQELPLLPLAEVAPGCWQGALVLPNRDATIHFEYSSHGGLTSLAR